MAGEWNDSCSDSDSLSRASPRRSSLSQLTPNLPRTSTPTLEVKPTMTRPSLPQQHGEAHRASALTDSGIPFHRTVQLSSTASNLQSQLKVQTDVNRELKRLLVASVGSSLEYRLQQIVQEKAELAQDLDLSLQQVVNNNEELDQVSIECDIWRSKFIASRVMIDELASWKAKLSLQLRESHKCLQYMLCEREEIARELVECRAHLQKCLPGLDKLPTRSHSHNMKTSASGSRIAAVAPVQYGSKGSYPPMSGMHTCITWDGSN